jgi:hypothetical protein
MYCLNCRYPLIALDTHRCPECGRPFNPQDPGTFARRAAVPVRERRFSAKLPAALVLLVALALGRTLLWAGPPAAFVVMAVYPAWMAVMIWPALALARLELLHGWLYWTSVAIAVGLALGAPDGWPGMAIGAAVGFVSGLVKTQWET